MRQMRDNSQQVYYRRVFLETGFHSLELLKPLATGDEPFKWYSETMHPHFAVYLPEKVVAREVEIS